MEAAARQYLDLAREFLRPPPPRLIAIGGFSGSGKSTLARGLARYVGAAPGALILRSDVIRKTLLGVTPRQRLGTEGLFVGDDTACLRRGPRAASGGAQGWPLGHRRRGVREPGDRDAIAATARDAGVSFSGLGSTRRATR